MPMKAETADGNVIVLEKECSCVTHDEPHWIHMDAMWRKSNRQLLATGGLAVSARIASAMAVFLVCFGKCWPLTDGSRTVDKWTEIEDTFLTDVPMLRKGRKSVPDPDVEPTQAWLFLYACQLTPKKRRVRRKRQLKVLTVDGSLDMERQIQAFVERDDVIPIADQSKPSEYIQSGAMPVELLTADILASERA